MGKNNWRVIKQEIKFDHPWVRMVVETLERDGETRPYYYLESPLDSVATVGVTEDRQVVLTHQYRHPVGASITDLPGGRIEPGEDPLAAARREFEEETGYHPRQLLPLGRLNPFPGSLRVTLHLFFASGLERGPQRLDPDEELDVLLRPFDEVYAELLAGQHIDGALQTGLLLARARGLI